jgi:hypothetical protein
MQILIAYQLLVKISGDVPDMPLHWDGNGKRA